MVGERCIKQHFIAKATGGREADMVTLMLLPLPNPPHALITQTLVMLAPKNALMV
jgi:hypothetical protein